ncbi:flagellar protein export ATPase FliI [Thermospira aquatica]|uniref:Flagellar protein export ATPase FliI n=1 Tax=Thermospira aquatica TaxID=2828656 RepID=A0AAX3BC06_9SPIR|nr:flagellar protein export ATPase FliI [Thermospira aquatica]URA09618.1 flagellar protein export ATPase FliI [Thermospira aquatica]
MKAVYSSPSLPEAFLDEEILPNREDVYFKYEQAVERVVPVKTIGRVTNVVGLTIEATGPFGAIGDVCWVETEQGQKVMAEIAGFRDKKTIIMPLGELRGISPGMRVVNTRRKLEVPVGNEVLGRILGGDGEPIDGKGQIQVPLMYPVDRQPPSAYQRKRITEVMVTGIRAIDGLLTVGKGQRVGIFSGSGVGKSTLLGMIARNTLADVNVIALIGERGREVREFIERDLGEEGLKRSVVVVVTSDEPPMRRIRGAYVATAIAEYFRDQGFDVMFMMDSATRFAMAQREVGLAVGEVPATKGYTPSVFSLLPRLMERTGTSDKGSITAFYTVLVEGDDVNEPISDTVRGILDGHIVLSRQLAQKNHYPAIDVLASVSRLMVDVASEEHKLLAAKVKELLATYREAEDLIRIGAYVRGSDPKIDEALLRISAIEAFVKQGIFEKVSFDETMFQLQRILVEGRKVRTPGMPRP